MGSVVIVAVDPGLVGGVASGIGGEVAGVCPFGGERVVEAFNFPVRLRPRWSGELVLHCLAERLVEHA